MAIYSSTTGWVKPRVNRGARNAHLLPEINTRLNRIITGARSEQAVANRVLENYCELWKKMLNGRPCTCTYEKQEEELSKEQFNGVNIEDYLVTGNLQLTVAKEFCPLCFSTGIIGGYQQSGVDTIILDASLEPETHEVYLIHDRPWWFQCGPSVGSVSWDLTVPSYFNEVTDIVLRWKTRPPTFWELTVNGEELTKDTLASFAGEKVRVTLKMSDNGKGNDSDVGLVGIWLQFEVTHALVPIELPNVSKDFSGAFTVGGEVTNSLQVNFDATQGVITPYDIFVTPNGWCWRITHVEYDSTIPIDVDYNCEARLVRSFENYYVVPSKYLQKNYPVKEYVFI